MKPSEEGRLRSQAKNTVGVQLVCSVLRKFPTRIRVHGRSQHHTHPITVDLVPNQVTGLEIHGTSISRGRRVLHSLFFHPENHCRVEVRHTGRNQDSNVGEVGPVGPRRKNIDECTGVPVPNDGLVPNEVTPFKVDVVVTVVLDFHTYFLTDTRRRDPISCSTTRPSFHITR